MNPKMPKQAPPGFVISVSINTAAEPLLPATWADGEEVYPTTICKLKTGQNTAATVWDRQQAVRTNSCRKGARKMVLTASHETQGGGT